MRHEQFGEQFKELLQQGDELGFMPRGIVQAIVAVAFPDVKCAIENNQGHELVFNQGEEVDA